MKRIISLALSLLILILLPQWAFADGERAVYYFENNLKNEITQTEDLQVLSNALTSTTNTAKFVENGFEGYSLNFDKTYGIKLGSVGRTFSLSAMVKMSSTNDVNAIFFKNMGSMSNEKWVGVITNNQGLPTVWTHDGSGYRWSKVINGTQSILNNWVYIVYTENNGFASLYVNGDLIGSSYVVTADTADIYLGATFWSADAITAQIDNLAIYDRVLSQSEVSSQFTQLAQKMLGFLHVPKLAVSNISLPQSIGNLPLIWQSSDEGVITKNGVVTRPNDEDKIVTLTATISGTGISKEFTVKVLSTKKGEGNDEIILQYLFTEEDGDVIFDHSGNGNHGTGYNGITTDENGGYFDGVDDYVQMPNGIVSGRDNITIAIRVKPQILKTHQFTYCIGNSSTSGYMFLNTSRPDTNTVRFAITRTTYSSEVDIASVPGVRENEDASIVVVLKDGHGYLYYNGILAMDKYLGIKPSDLGYTTFNTLAKSPYSGDAYYKGYIKEFTIYSYAMEKEEVSEKYKKDEDVEYVIENPVKSISFDRVSFERGVKASAGVELLKDCFVTLAIYDGNDELINQTTNYFDAGTHTIEAPFTKTVKDYRAVLFAYDEDGMVNNIYQIAKEGIFISHTIEDGKILITIINDKDEVISGQIIIASYNEDGSLNKVQIKDAQVEASSTADLEFSYTENLRTKVFFWNSLNNMVPLAVIE